MKKFNIVLLISLYFNFNLNCMHRMGRLAKQAVSVLTRQVPFRTTANLFRTPASSLMISGLNSHSQSSRSFSRLPAWSPVYIGSNYGGHQKVYVVPIADGLSRRRYAVNEDGEGTLLRGSVMEEIEQDIRDPEGRLIGVVVTQLDRFGNIVGEYTLEVESTTVEEF